jgi:predicted nuclease with RNAse H fold
MVEGTRRETKTSVAARAETQQGLARYIDGLTLPASDLLSADLLDALAAALTAVAYHKGQCRAIGEADEGQIVLPSPDFAQATQACSLAMRSHGLAAGG